VGEEDAVFAVSFRIVAEAVGGKSYDERYGSTIAAIMKNGRHWEHTTSFYFVNTMETGSRFLQRLTTECGLDPKADQLIVATVRIPPSGPVFGTIGPKDARTVRTALGLP
jgi:hypothetical protein